MDDTCTYQIEVRGQADENDLNAMSPLRLMVVQANADTKHPADKEPPCTSMLLAVRTDQSGLIGLLRHLHARGLVLLSVCREQ
jgi:hypothetical protein